METTQETTSLIHLVETSGLEKSKGSVIADTLSSFFAKASEWKETIDAMVITDPSDVGKMKMAKEGRLYLKNLRLGGEKIIKAKREEVKARMADDVLEDNLWLKALQMMEATYKNLESKLEEKEKFAERFEAERKEKLRNERLALLAPYQEFFPVGMESILGEMKDEEFKKLLAGSKLQLVAKQEAERKAEEERVAKEKAEEEEREKIRLENEKLKAEADEEARAEAELSKGDKEKLVSFLSDIEALKSKYTFKSKKYKTLQNSINELLDKTVAYGKSKVQ